MLRSATIVYELFWKIVSPLFIAKKGSKNKKIKLAEDGKVFADDAKIAETFNSFFGSIVKTSFVIREMKLICYCRQWKKYSKYPSILTVKRYFKNQTEFSLVPVDKDFTTKGINNLNTKKAAPRSDIPVKMLKLNNDILFQYLFQIFNESIEVANFPNELKYADTPQFIKKITYTKKRIIDLLVLYLLYPKYSNVVFLIKCMKTLTIHCLDIRWATERYVALNIYWLQCLKNGRKISIKV